MITAYSVLTSFLWFNIGILIIAILRKSSNIVSLNYSSTILMLVMSCTIRMFFSIEFPFAIEFHSDIILPYIISAFDVKIPTTLPGMIEFGLGDFLILTWIIGIVILAIRQFKSYNNFYRKILLSKVRMDCTIEEIYVSECKKLNIKKSPQLILSNETLIPFTTGFTKPIVVMPLINLSEEEQSFILRHELCHYCNRDIWLKFFISILCIIFWWDPLIYLLKKDLQQILEIRCDLLTCNNLSEHNRLMYLQAIIKILKYCSESKKTYFLSSGFISKKKDTHNIKQRFNISLNYFDRKLKMTHNLQLFVITCIFYLISYTFVLQPFYEPPDNIWDNAEMISPENSYIKKENNEFKRKRLNLG